MDEHKRPLHLNQKQEDKKTTNNEFSNRHFSLLFQIGQNCRYHHKRFAFFNRLDKLNKIFTYIAGSSAVVSLLSKQYETISIILNLALLAFGAIDAFVGLNDKARDYFEFYQQYKRLNRQLKDAKTLDDLIAIEKAIDDIECNEPPILYVLSEICWNEEAAYQRIDSKNFRKIEPLQVLFAQWFDLYPFRIVKNSTQV